MVTLFQIGCLTSDPSLKKTSKPSRQQTLASLSIRKKIISFPCRKVVKKLDIWAQELLFFPQKLQVLSHYGLGTYVLTMARNGLVMV